MSPPENKRPMNLTELRNGYKHTMFISARHALLDHRDQGKPEFPRPHIDCLDCNTQLSVCAGEKNRIHWRHTQANINCTATRHTFEHAEAQHLLCDYLNRRNRVVCQLVEPCCFKLTDFEIQCGQGERCATEVSVYDSENNRGVFDVAILRADGSVRIGLEVYHTHITTTFSPRAQYDWFEFDAYHIIDKIDYAVSSTILTPYKSFPVQQSEHDTKKCREYYKSTTALGLYGYNRWTPIASPAWPIFLKRKMCMYCRKSFPWVSKEKPCHFKCAIEAWKENLCLKAQPHIVQFVQDTLGGNFMRHPIWIPRGDKIFEVGCHQCPKCKDHNVHVCLNIYMKSIWFECKDKCFPIKNY